MSIANETEQYLGEVAAKEQVRRELKQLRKHPLAKCEECPLQKDGQFVPSVGPSQAEIAIVGEAPGAYEAKAGEPFVGESGRLLNAVLKHYKIPRKEVFLSNACLCRHQDGTTPTAKALQACRPRLVAELQDRNVQDVVALGNSSAQSILQTRTGITSLRVGQGHTNEADLPGVRVLCTFHPAAALRQAGFFPSIVTDFGKLKGFSATWYEPKWKAFEFPAEALQALAELQEIEGPVTVDIESNIEKDMCLVPETRVLKRDLTWVQLGLLEPGDDLVAFDERSVSQMQVATVTATGRKTQPCYRVTTKRASIVCSANHLWPVKTCLAAGYQWRTTRALFDGLERGGTYLLPWLASPWEPDSSYEAGYIAGLLDGEGTLYTNGAKKYMAISQNGGAVFDQTVKFLSNAGYVFQTGNRDPNKTNSPKYVQFTDRDQILRALGSYRPVRLLERADSVWLGRRSYHTDPILSIEYLGNRETVTIETTTKTLVAEGYLTHNSFEQPSRHTLLCVGLEFRPGRGVVIGEVALRFDAVRQALLKYLLTHPVRCHNGKFDLKGLYAKLRGFLDEGQQLRLFSDTMLKNYCLDERQGVHSLGYLGIEKLGTPNWKGVLEKHKGPKDGYGVIPRPILYEYNAKDIHVTDMLDEILDKELAEYPELQKLHEFLCRASDELMYVELNGIGVDLKYNEQLMFEFETSLEAIENQIRATIPQERWEATALFQSKKNPILFNPRSPQQVKAVVRDVFGLRLPMKMNQKKEYSETTDVEALKGLLEKNLGKPSEQFFRSMLEHRKEAKLYGTYVKGLRKRVYRGRVYPTFLLHGTTTGRLSCRNPNLQNIPRGSAMRRQFVPVKQENVFVEGDFGQNELRVLCWLAQDEYLREIFNDPTRDLFDELTPRLYGDVSYLDKAALKEKRIRVKAYVYGLSYGREAYSIALEHKMPVVEAERGMQIFFEVIPATVKFREETRNKVLNGEDLITPFGRHRRFPLITNANRKDVLNEALAFLPQSIGSDICLDAFVHVRPRLKGLGFVRNIVHDSQLVECHRDAAEEVRNIMQEEMLAAAQRVVGDYVKFKVDFSVGKSWGDLESFNALAA